MMSEMLNELLPGQSQPDDTQLLQVCLCVCVCVSEVPLGAVDCEYSVFAVASLRT